MSPMPLYQLKSEAHQWLDRVASFSINLWII
jgi:hypothetical protein